MAQQAHTIVLKEAKNDGFAKPGVLVNKLTKNTLAGLPTNVMISGPDSVVVSVASSLKSANGMIKKHCEPCEFKLVGNWKQHKKDKHGGVEVLSVKCTGD
jgi:hypothetical protein